MLQKNNIDLISAFAFNDSLLKVEKCELTESHASHM